MSFSKAQKNFKKFHGKTSEKTFFLSIPDQALKNLTYLGKGYSVDYLSTKKFKGTHKERHYTHKLGAGVKIYVTGDKKFLIIGGGNFRVTDWMRG